uniref:Uncharacterized protein n=1 Tax=Arundo donax TaxID=35708 RepID=A0A0A8ZCX9_ARUDO
MKRKYKSMQNYLIGSLVDLVRRRLKNQDEVQKGQSRLTRFQITKSRD